jgi:hypothetical protein
VGFLVGARAKQLMAALQMAPSALKSLLKSMATTPEDSNGAEDAQGDQEEELEVKDIHDFLDTDAIPGLDDHADLIFNPIVMYKIKVAKDEARKEKRRQQLIADGYDPDAMDEDEANAAAGGAGAIRQNALATLVEHGARVTPVSGGLSAEAAAREERKRQIRTIDSYLARSMDLDVARVPVAHRKAATLGTRKYTSALDMARITSIKRAGGDTDARWGRVLTVAKSARNQLREIKRTKPHLLGPKPTRLTAKRKSLKGEEPLGFEKGGEEEEEEDSDDDGEPQRRGARNLAAELSTLTQEMLDASSEEGEEGDGDADYKADDADLAA